MSQTAGLMMLSEHLSDAVEACHQGIYLFLRVVQGEGGADCSADTQTIHQGLRTVMTRADGDAEAVEQGADVEVVDLTNIETYDGITRS
jgi:hypothetical protein